MTRVITTALADAGQLAAELLSPVGWADPFPIYRRLHACGQVVQISGGPALVAGYAAAESALRDPRLLVEDAAYLDRIVPSWRDHPSRSVLNMSMIFADGSDHDRMRRLVGRVFTARSVDELRPSVIRRVSTLLDGLAERGADHSPVDFIAEFAFRVPVSVICDLLGVPESDRAGFRQPVAALSRAVEPGWIYADLAAADEAAAELSAYFSRLLAERRSHPSTDLLSAMIAANDSAEDPLNNDEIVGNAVFLLFAGFETTVGLLGNGLMALLEHRDAFARLRGRPDLGPAYIEEMLRYDAPVQLTARRAGADLQIEGVALPAGGSVIVMMGAANRDPRRFADPDRFDPDRVDNQPLSFGSGIHYCLGARLARLEARLALPMFVERFPAAELAETPARLDRLNLRAFATLPVTLT